MTSIDDLPALNGIDPIEAAEKLTAMLDLASVGLEVRGGRIVGTDSRATAYLYLADAEDRRTIVTFETLRDFGTHTKLALEVAVATGATPALKAAQALKAVSYLRALAEHEEALTTDEISAGWGVAYLQSAEVLTVDMSDQEQRWQAFSHLEQIDPVAKARQENVSIARASLVLEHLDGTRFVRTGWFRQYVRQEDTISFQEIAQRMKRVGWRLRESRGKQGRVKATAPGRRASLIWSFYEVPPAWEDGTSAGPEAGDPR